MPSPTVDALVSQFQKEYGKGIGARGLSLPAAKRLPSGILSFDYATGGGIPRNRMTMIYGTESSGKTNLALRLIAEHQRRFPEKTCVFEDIEGTLETEGPDGSRESSWAARMGVDVERLVVIRPSYAEQVVDTVEKFLYAPDCGLIALDSIAAMSTMQELEKSAESANPGQAGLAVGKLVRKCTAALIEADKGGYCPTLLWINQIRFKIGVMHGNPETIPGGQGQLFMAGLRVRLYGKNIVDPKVSKDMPVYKETSGILHKWKCNVVNRTFEYKMLMLDTSKGRVGDTNDWPQAKQLLEEHGLLARPDKAGPLVYLGEHKFDSYTKFWAWLKADPARFDDARTRVLKKVFATPIALPAATEEDVGE